MARRKKQDEDEPQDNQDNLNNDSDDTFGLPEVEYEPINRDEPVKETVVEEPVYETPRVEEEPKTETYEYKEEVVEPDPYEHEEKILQFSIHIDSAVEPAQHFANCFTVRRRYKRDTGVRQ